MALNIDYLMREFAQDLSERTGWLTEDSIRYYIFKAFLSQDSRLDNYTLELPYDYLEKNDEKVSGRNYPIYLPADHGLLKQNGALDQELDLYYEDNGEPVCMEIKFHRHTSEKAFPHPLAAGSLFNDLRRLQLIQPHTPGRIRRLFLYVTDSEMCKYLGKSVKNSKYRDALNEFYGGSGCSFTMPKDRPDTFAKASSKSFSEEFRAAYPDWKTGIEYKLLFKQDGIVCNSPSIKVDDESKKTIDIRLYEIL